MKRILLKISGEAFNAPGQKWIEAEYVQKIAKLIAHVQQTWVELVIVLGWGNIYRGSNLIAAGVDAADSHNMSMLSTVFNSVTLKNFLQKEGIDAVILDALHVEFLESYSADRARKYLEQWRIVICSSGTGAPFFTTDTGGILRALETNCNAFIKLTKVDGVYDVDPQTHPQAQKFDSLSYNDFMQKDLKVLDQTGLIMARDNNLPLYVTHIDDTHGVKNIISGKKAGTKIS